MERCTACGEFREREDMECKTINSLPICKCKICWAKENHDM